MPARRAGRHSATSSSGAKARRSPTTRSPPERGRLLLLARGARCSAKTASPGPANLYLYRDGQIRARRILGSGGNGALTRIQVSPDGSHAAFVTNAELTAYDNEGFAEMYSFDPATGTLECVSCIPAGRTPDATSKQASPASSCRTTAGRSSGRRTPWLPKTPTKASDVYEYVEGRPQLISTGRGQIFAQADWANHPDHADGRQPERRRRLLRDLRHAGPPGRKRRVPEVLRRPHRWRLRVHPQIATVRSRRRVPRGWQRAPGRRP